MLTRKLSLPLTKPQCLSLIGSLTRTRSTRPATQLHAVLLSSCLLNNGLASKLAIAYAISGQTSLAHHLFDEIPQRDPSLYSALIRGNVQTGQCNIALQLFAQMFAAAFRPDNFAYPFALKACGDVGDPHLGSQIHCNAFVSGYASNEYVQNCLIAMYMSCGRKEEGSMVFDEMQNRSVVSWNTMIAGLHQNGHSEKALTVFDQMLGNGVEIDRATAVSVLPACAQARDLETGRRVHKMVDDKGFAWYLPVRNSLIDMYAKCESLEEARRVFDDDEEECEKDVVSWTAMIGGYALNGHVVEALDVCYQMQLSGIRPNSVTLSSLLTACGTLASVRHGKCIHGSCIRLGLQSDIAVETALIDLYWKCSAMDLCLRVFAAGSKRRATWNAVISGFARRGQANESLEYFKLMLSEGATMSTDLATIASVLPAFSSIADMHQAKNLHCHLTKTGFLRSIEVTTGLIDVYAKAGCLDTAWTLFDELPVKDFVSWSAMIGGYGMHGHARTAIWLLDRMVEHGVEPNEVTFTSLLYSCSHSGLVDEGLELFARMVEVHGVKARAEHYACIVDLLGRAGRVEEAYRVAQGMAFSGSQVAVWGALLGACNVHGNVEVGEVAARRMFELEPENTGNYVLLGNIYAAAGRWQDAEKLRRGVVERGLRKAPGCSLI